MKKSILGRTIWLAVILGLIYFGIALAGTITAVETAKPMSTSEIMQSIFIMLFTAVMLWLEPRARAYFKKGDEEAAVRIKAIENERIRTRLDAGRVELRKAVEASFSEFMLGLTAEQAKDGRISKEELVGVAKKSVDSFIKSSSDSTSDLMKRLGMDLYECAEQEVKDFALRVRDRFRPAAETKIPGTVN